jgi:hypothetical protein
VHVHLVVTVPILTYNKVICQPEWVAARIATRILHSDKYLHAGDNTKVCMPNTILLSLGNSDL